MLKNKFAVITGGSDGIGLGITSAFAQNGADLCLISRDIGKLEKEKEHLSVYGVNVYVISSDLSVSENVRMAAKKLLEQSFI
ncbi:SDR family NAD(P)-dependent oxidoreductase [Parabacteroides sp. Marseille-P3160]|uniref:SDR family NAD(P)-dependent oxidoreductase n=1 Tax=Parabacteroides sp. Marseille-P3160 TaxID=1917887 RepID=UPI0009B99438|nr:SDR family NAD(P)-dependent oxidoreductase [Parabacteroides sp. Marseille-P3160]